MFASVSRERISSAEKWFHEDIECDGDKECLEDIEMFIYFAFEEAGLIIDDIVVAAIIIMNVV